MDLESGSHFGSHHDEREVLARDALRYAGEQAQRTKSTMHSPTVSETSWDWLPGYQILERLGRGGQGTVYKARHVKTGRLMAIKVLHDEALASDRNRARLAQEVQVLARLRHPNIVRLHDGSVGSDCGCGYLIMDYVPGKPLHVHLEWFRHSTTPTGNSPRNTQEFVDEVVRVFVKICGGVNAAHQLGVIHRDLKPSNILIDSDGEPHILDFGLAKVIAEDGSSISPMEITATGQILGSLYWSSPEQIAARPDDLDVRTDIYSLGVSLYHGLTENMPFEVNRPIAEIMDQIRFESSARALSFPREVKPDLRAIVLKTLQKDRTRRYQSVTQLQEDLERYLVGAPISVRSGETWYRLRKNAQRHRMLTAMIALAVLFGIVYSASMTVLYRKALSAEQDQARSAAETRSLLAATLKAFQASTAEAKRLAHLPGATPHREAMLQCNIDALQPLATQSLVDSGIRFQLARAISGLADWACDMQLYEKCRSLRQSSRSLLDELARERPDEPAYQRELASELVRSESESTGDDSANSARRSHDILLKLVYEHPENMDYLDDLSWSFERLGGLALRNRDLTTARQYLETRHQLAQKLLADEPDNPDRLVGLRNSHSLLSHLFAALYDEPSAMTHTLMAGDILERLHSLQPNRLDLAGDLAEWHIARAVRLAECFDLDEALRHADRAAELADQIGLHEQDQISVRRLFGRVLTAYTHIYHINGGDPQQFEQYAQEALELLRQQFQHDPASGERLEALIKGVTTCAVAAHRLGQLECARKYVLEARSLVNEALEHPQFTPAMLCSMVSGMFLTWEPPEFYDPLFALEITEKANRSLPNDAVVLYHLAMAQHSVGDDEAARKSIQSAIDHCAIRDRDSFYNHLDKLRNEIEESVKARRCAAKLESLGPEQ